MDLGREHRGRSHLYLRWSAGDAVAVRWCGAMIYVYGTAGASIEQINNSTGTVTGKCTYGAYGTPTCEGTATTPLGYDAQYTSTDTGLVYMRSRVYDPPPRPRRRFARATDVRIMQLRTVDVAQRLAAAVVATLVARITRTEVCAT
jgi:hypothetical protein